MPVSPFLSLITSKLRGEPRYVVVGDVNARYVNLRERFLDGVENGCMYAKPLDNLRAPNENAQLLGGILSQHMLLVNGYKLIANHFAILLLTVKSQCGFQNWITYMFQNL